MKSVQQYLNEQFKQAHPTAYKFAVALNKSMQERDFSSFLSDSRLLMALFLDPRFKDGPISSQTRATTKQDLINAASFFARINSRNRVLGYRKHF